MAHNLKPVMFEMSKVRGYWDMELWHSNHMKRPVNFFFLFFFVFFSVQTSSKLNMKRLAVLKTAKSIPDPYLNY